jgi:DNA-binding Xre family transcriptional regulator
MDAEPSMQFVRWTSKKVFAVLDKTIRTPEWSNDKLLGIRNAKVREAIEQMIKLGVINLRKLEELCDSLEINKGNLNA